MMTSFDYNYQNAFRWNLCYDDLYFFRKEKNTEYNSVPQSNLVDVVKWRYHENALSPVYNHILHISATYPWVCCEFCGFARSLGSATFGTTIPCTVSTHTCRSRPPEEGNSHRPLITTRFNSSPLNSCTLLTREEQSPKQLHLFVKSTASLFDPKVWMYNLHLFQGHRSQSSVSHTISIIGHLCDTVTRDLRV